MGWNPAANAENPSCQKVSQQSCLEQSTVQYVGSRQRMHFSGECSRGDPLMEGVRWPPPPAPCLTGGGAPGFLKPRIPGNDSVAATLPGFSFATWEWPDVCTGNCHRLRSETSWPGRGWGSSCSRTCRGCWAPLSHGIGSSQGSCSSHGEWRGCPTRGGTTLLSPALPLPLPLPLALSLSTPSCNAMSRGPVCGMPIWSCSQEAPPASQPSSHVPSKLMSQPCLFWPIVILMGCGGCCCC
mmetsp:Transcript_116/g.388  ORF Transcript_116/g.388 Transcript_116/m.388 type:complete len:240 (-) Transcript_116:619-1338(-)